MLRARRALAKALVAPMVATVLVVGMAPDRRRARGARGQQRAWSVTRLSWWT